MKKAGKSKTTVYLVGAGPGDAGLITVRGSELLKTADCIICDKLANPVLLSMAKPGTEIIHTPKRIGEGSFTQDKINQLLLDKAKEGKIVVRLKGGDPCIFGRGNEEAAVLAKAGIDFEIVPGITSGIAAGEYAGIMLTDRNYSSQVVFVTGKEAENKEQSGIDWQWLARFNGTIVFYMGMGNLEFITSELIRNGIAEDTPAAVIANATTPQQKVVKGTVRNINRKCVEGKVEAPAIVVIGQAARGDNELDWFMKKPLFGKNIVITRDAEGNRDLAEKIMRRGGTAIDFPTIKIRPLTNESSFIEAVSLLAEFDWVVFTSVNGVKFFFDFVNELGKDARVFGSAKIAAIGKETAAKLGQFGIKADFVPGVFTSVELGRQLIEHVNLKGKKVLLLRSELAGDELSVILEHAGAEVRNESLYTIETQKNDTEILTAKIDWLTFASPSAVRGFFEQVPKERVGRGVKIASIGPVTSAELRQINVNIDIEAQEHTFEGLLDAIEES